MSDAEQPINTSNPHREYYDAWFYGFNDSIERVLQFGIGDGAMFRELEEYFPNATIIGLGAFQEDKSHESERRQVVVGSQTNPEVLAYLREQGPFSLIIDKGLGQTTAQTYAFKEMGHYVADGGTYIVENLQTSRDPNLGGSEDLQGSSIAHLSWVLSNTAVNINNGWMCGVVAPNIVFLRRG